MFDPRQKAKEPFRQQPPERPEMSKRILLGAAAGLAALGVWLLHAQPGHGQAEGAAPTATATPAGPFWPQFNGPRGDNKSPDQGLLKAWPSGGPRLLWTYEGCGSGFSSVTLAAGMIFTAGDFDNDEKIVALNSAGQLRWTALNGKAWKSPWGGARATPTYSDGMVYHLNAYGRLAAYEAATGKPVWTFDFPRDGMSQGGFAESVVIDGNNLICMPGARNEFVMALDKKTGKTVWVSDFKRGDNASYVTPIIVEHDNRREIIHASLHYLLALDATTGKVNWYVRHNDVRHCSVVASSPIWDAGRVFLTLGYGAGSQVFQVDPSGDQATRVWKHDASGSEHGGAILHNGHVYVAGNYVYPRGTWMEKEAREGKLYCLDFASGQEKWAAPTGRCSLTYSDGRLYCFNEFGKMYLIEASPDRCKVLGEFIVPKKDKVYTLSHPVVIAGRLYIRHQNLLYVYDVKG